jgi:hypothetical protein
MPAVSAKGVLMMGTKKVGALSSRRKRAVGYYSIIKDKIFLKHHALNVLFLVFRFMLMYNFVEREGIEIQILLIVIEVI